MQDRHPNALPLALLLLVLSFGAGVRVFGLRWEDNLRNYPHPDERHLANTMTRVSVPFPIDWKLLGDPDHSPLNPRRLIPGSEDEHYDLAYGTLPVYLYRSVAVILSRLLRAPELDSYYAYGQIGRAITVLFSLLTLLWVYLLGRRVFGTPTALLAAAMLSACVLHIQLSHFMTVDLLMSAMLTAGLLVSVRFAQQGRTIDALWIGVLLGLSMSCKFNGVTLGAGIASAYGVAWLGGKRRLPDLLAYCVPLTVIGWALSFGLLEYYAVRDPYTYVQAIGTQAKMVSGETDWPYTRQYVNTAPYLFQLKNLLAWGMGWTLGISAAAGTVTAAIELAVRFVSGITRRFRQDAGRAPLLAWIGTPRYAGMVVLLGWAIPFSVYTGQLEVKFLRYLLPLMPVLCLLAAHAALLANKSLSTAWHRVIRSVEPARSVIDWIIPTFVLLPTALWALAYMRVYAQEHPWQAASRWFYQHAPDGSTYTWEAWGDPLPTDLPDEGLYRSMHAYHDVWMQMYHDLPPDAKLQHIVDSLRQADYVILSTPRLYLSIARLPWRYPVEIRYYELLFTDQLGFRRVAKFTAYPGLGPLTVDDIDADQSFYDYDHPPVLIWEKVRDLSDAEWQALFVEQLAATPRASRQGNAAPVRLPIP